MTNFLHLSDLPDGLDFGIWGADCTAWPFHSRHEALMSGKMNSETRPTVRLRPKAESRAIQ